MSYEDNKTPFVKEFNGVKAPAGFHYMPNGKLMSDADHVALYGYLEQTITSFDINLQDLNPNGETRSFTVNGDENAVFSLEVFKTSIDTSVSTTDKYYDFKTRTFVTGKTKLTKRKVGSGYNSFIKFPTPDGNEEESRDVYTITLIAETVHNIKTKHAIYLEVRNADDSININQSQGSNSNILKKELYQSNNVSPLPLTISSIAPSLTNTSTGTVNGATSSSNRIVLDAVTTESPRVGDLVTGTGIAASVHALVTKINPDNDNALEIEISNPDSATNDDTLTFTPPFNGITHVRKEIPTYSGANFRTSFTLNVTAATGRSLNVFRTPTTDDLLTLTAVTFGSAALPIDGENTSSSSVFYRWPVTNIANLAEGMVLDPSRSGTGANTTTPAKISSYTATTSTTKIVEEEYGNEIESITVEDFTLSAVDPDGNPVTAVDKNGRVTAQAGNIIFDTQQADALKSDSNVYIYAYGAQGILDMTGMTISLTDVEITQAQVSTTTTSAVSSATIPLTEVGNVTQGMTLRGVGIDRSSAAPTVVSKAAKSGGANITASASQSIESGQTIFFDGGTNQVTITGVLEINNFPPAGADVYFDIERFMSAV